MTRLLLAATAVVILIALLVVFGPNLVDLEARKGLITDAIEDETGRAAHIDGAVDLALVPTPRIAVHGLRLANRAGAREADMVQVPVLEAELALGPLFRGELVVERLRLIDPVVVLERLADGSANWDFTTPEPTDGSAAGALTPTADPATQGIGLVAIEGGVITYRDTEAGLDHRFENVSGEAKGERASGPLAADLSFAVNGIDLALTAKAGESVPGRSRPFSLELAAPEVGATLGLLGALAEGPRLTGKLTLQADSLARLLTALSQASGRDLALAVPDKAASAAGNLTLDAAALGFDAITASLGQAAATGAISVALTAPRRVDATLAVKHFDLDAWLASVPDRSAGAGANAGTTAASAAPAAGEAAATSGSLDLEIEALTFRGEVVRQLVATAHFAAGTLTLDRVSALLPGSSDLNASGTLTGIGGALQFDGRVEAASDNLRALLAWLALAPPGVPSDRLRSAVLTSSIRATPDVIQVFGADVRLDSSRFTGGAAYALRERVSFSLDGAIDRLNLDAYLPPPAAAVAAGKPDAASPAAGEREGEHEGGALAVLDTFDTDLKIRAGELTYREIPIKDARLTARLVAGRLDLTDLQLGDVAGARVAVAGVGQGFAAKPTFAGTLDVKAGAPDPLFRLLDIAWPTPGERLKPFTLGGAIAGEARALKLDLAGTAAASDFSVTGTLADLSPTAAIDVQVAVRNPSAKGLLSQFVSASDATWLAGAGAVRGRLSGSLARLDIDLLAEAGPTLTAKGRIASPLAAPAYDLALVLAHPDLTQLLRDLGSDPAATNLGPLALSARVSGDATATSIGGLAGRIGPVAIEGEGTLALSGAQPRLSGRLKTSEILLDLLLPRQSDPAAAASGGTPTGAKGAAPGRWSREPIELSLFRGSQGAVALSAVALHRGGYSIERPSANLAWGDGLVRLDEVRGALFGGELALAARIKDAETPALALVGSLSGADVPAILSATGAEPRLTGHLDVGMEVSASGRSEEELVSSLDGAVDFTAQEGVVRGVDLPALSDRLHQLDAVPDFLNLLQHTGAEGETNYSAISGTFALEDGIGRSSDLRATFAAGRGAGTATIDLPRWQLAMQSELWLTDHPKAPPLGVVFAGPIDAPKRDLKTRQLEAFLGQRLQKRVLPRLLKGKLGEKLERITGAPPAVEEIAPTESPVEPAAPDVEDTLRQLFDLMPGD